MAKGKDAAKRRAAKRQAKEKRRKEVNRLIRAVRRATPRPGAAGGPPVDPYVGWDPATGLEVLARRWGLSFDETVDRMEDLAATGVLPPEGAARRTDLDDLAEADLREILALRGIGMEPAVFAERVRECDDFATLEAPLIAPLTSAVDRDVVRLALRAWWRLAEPDLPAREDLLVEGFALPTGDDLQPDDFDAHLRFAERVLAWVRPTHPPEALEALARMAGPGGVSEWLGQLGGLAFDRFSAAELLDDPSAVEAPARAAAVFAALRDRVGHWPAVADATLVEEVYLRAATGDLDGAQRLAAAWVEAWPGRGRAWEARAWAEGPQGGWAPDAIERAIAWVEAGLARAETEREPLAELGDFLRLAREQVRADAAPE